MTKFHTTLLCLLAVITLPAFTLEKGEVTATQSQTISDGAFSQPSDERKAQDALPMSKDAIWATLATTKVTLDEKKGAYSAVFSDAVKGLAGKQLTVSGFILPLETTEKFRHFLLSKRTPTCPFCPPGQPYEIIDVTTTSPIPWTDDLATFVGTFSLTNNQELGVFFQLNGAKKK